MPEREQLSLFETNIHNPYLGKRWEKVRTAYKLFKESTGKTLNIEDIVSRTGWSTSTIKTYITKRWRGFLSETSTRSYYVHELNMSESNFCMFHSQVGASKTDSPHINIKYTEKLGSGEFGTVWKAFDIDLGRTVAVKILHDVAGVYDTLFHAKQIAKVDYHPNVVPIYHYGLVPDPNEKMRSIQAVVMPFLNGITLEKRLEDIVPTEEAQSIGIGICNGLKQIHKNDLIHGDLHAKNIMICGNIPVLIDLMNRNAQTYKTPQTNKKSLDHDLLALSYLLQSVIEMSVAVPEHLVGSPLQCSSVDESLETFLDILDTDWEEEF